jgi:hypothetical protein
MTGNLPPNQPPQLSDDERCSGYIDLWKQTVEVQQHFNDLEWRIRGLALTAATFALGASAVAAKDGTKFFGISLGSGVLVAGLILWLGFYFVDRYWYHPLLIGSVRHGEKLEDELQAYLPIAGLTKDITAASHIKPPRGLGRVAGKNPDKTLRSEEKLRIFYWIGATTLILAAGFLQLAGCSSSNSPEPKPERVIELIRPPDATVAPTTTPVSPSSVAPAPKPAPSVSTTMTPPSAPSPSPSASAPG